MAITSTTDIANLSLDLLSAGNVTDIENPSTATEELLNRWYDQSRQKALREHPWNFAAKRAILAASTTDPLFGYDKAFPVPADFIRLLSINDTRFVADSPLQSSLYQLENNRILTTNLFDDSDTLRLVYVSDFKIVSQMDPMFIDILANELALSVAYKVTEANTVIQRIETLKKSRAAMAKAVDGQERPPQKVQRSNSRRVRRNNGSNIDSHRIIF